MLIVAAMYANTVTEHSILTKKFTAIAIFSDDNWGSMSNTYADGYYRDGQKSVTKNLNWQKFAFQSDKKLQQ